MANLGKLPVLELDSEYERQLLDAQNSVQTPMLVDLESSPSIEPVRHEINGLDISKCPFLGKMAIEDPERFNQLTQMPGFDSMMAGHGKQAAETKKSADRFEFAPKPVKPHETEFATARPNIQSESGRPLVASQQEAIRAYEIAVQAVVPAPEQNVSRVSELPVLKSVKPAAITASVITARPSKNELLLKSAEEARPAAVQVTTETALPIQKSNVELPQESDEAKQVAASPTSTAHKKTKTQEPRTIKDTKPAKIESMPATVKTLIEPSFTEKRVQRAAYQSANEREDYYQAEDSSQPATSLAVMAPLITELALDEATKDVSAQSTENTSEEPLTIEQPVLSVDVAETAATSETDALATELTATKATPFTEALTRDIPEMSDDTHVYIVLANIETQKIVTEIIAAMDTMDSAAESINQVEVIALIMELETQVETIIARLESSSEKPLVIEREAVLAALLQPRLGDAWQQIITSKRGTREVKMGYAPPALVFDGMAPDFKTRLTALLGAVAISWRPQLQ